VGTFTSLLAPAFNDQRWNFDNIFVWNLVLADLYIYYIALVLSLCTCVGHELSLDGCLVLGWMTCLFSVYLPLNQ
jgi:hypothetical protein